MMNELTLESRSHTVVYCSRAVFGAYLSSRIGVIGVGLFLRSDDEDSGRLVGVIDGACTLTSY